MDDFEEAIDFIQKLLSIRNKSTSDNWVHGELNLIKKQSIGIKSFLLLETRYGYNMQVCHSIFLPFRNCFNINNL